MAEAEPRLDMEALAVRPAVGERARHAAQQAAIHLARAVGVEDACQTAHAPIFVSK
jgi:hypothetical protein